MEKGKKLKGNGFVHPSEHRALEAEDKVFDMHERTQDICESIDERLDDIQKRIETKFHHRRKDDKNEKSTSG